MSLINRIEVSPLASVKEGAAEFYTPLSSHETMVVQIPPKTADDLFVHHFQTDQLFVVRGSFVLVVLQNRRYQYTALSEHRPTVVKIPPGIPHGSINASREPCVLLNAVIQNVQSMSEITVPSSDHFLTT